MSDLKLSAQLVEELRSVLTSHDAAAEDPGVSSQYLCAIVGFLLGQQEMPADQKNEIIDQLAAFMHHIMSRATARHILVETEAQCQSIIDDINGGADFAALAKEHSSCPSSRDGGSLGTFSPGQMVPEFDQACFEGNVGDVQGPIKTQFGFHVVQVTERS